MNKLALTTRHWHNTSKNKEIKAVDMVHDSSSICSAADHQQISSSEFLK